jgi:N-acetylglutamate synthase-like GNAT family acetyltransferase
MRPVPQIRRFRNADLPALARLWTEHFQSQGLACTSAVSPVVFEQAVMSRLFFEPRGFLVAEDPQGTLIGFAHWLDNPHAPDTANIVALCLLPEVDAGPVGAGLLAACEAAMRDAGKTTALGGSAQGDWTGYAGLPPLGPGEGILDADRRAVALFQQAGYSPQRRLTRYQIDLPGYRPPIDRALMALRRSTVLESALRLPSQWRHAAAFSHVDIERFTAKSRNGETVAWAEVLIGDPEAKIFPIGTAILDQWGSDASFDSQSAVRFIIANSLKELAARGLERVDAIADDRHPDRNHLLRSLRFEPRDEGTLFSKRLV